MKSTNDSYGICYCSDAIQILGLGDSLCSTCEWVATQYVIFEAEAQPQNRKSRQKSRRPQPLTPAQSRGQSKQAKPVQLQLTLEINGGSN